MSDTQFTILKIGSVIGHTFPMELLRYMLAKIGPTGGQHLELDLNFLLNQEFLIVLSEHHRKYLSYQFANTYLKVKSNTIH